MAAFDTLSRHYCQRSASCTSPAWPGPAALTCWRHVLQPCAHICTSLGILTSPGMLPLTVCLFCLLLCSCAYAKHISLQQKCHCWENSRPELAFAVCQCLSRPASLRHCPSTVHVHGCRSNGMVGDQVQCLAKHIFLPMASIHQADTNVHPFMVFVHAGRRALYSGTTGRTQGASEPVAIHCLRARCLTTVEHR